MNELIITKNLVQKDKKINTDYAYTFLNRLLKKNIIKKITKGKYTKSSNIFQISTNLYTPTYLSYWSASYFKGYTEQIVNEIQIASTKRHKTINFENYTINFIKLSKKMFFGFEKIKYGEEFIFVVTDEKLIIDCLNKEELIGNFDEIEKIVIESKINKIKMIEYLNRINNKALNKKVGFLLEKYKEMDLSKNINYKEKSYTKLSRYLAGTNINKKWKVKF